MVVLPFILDVCYFSLLVLLSPVILWKRWRQGKYRSGWHQKVRGRLPRRRSHSSPRIWIHAVSVGEVLQLRQVIAELVASRPELQILVTTTTETGYSVAKDKLTHCDVAFFPLDFSRTVSRALRRVAPDLIVLVELELWPNFLNAAFRRSVPVMLMNGRLSARSYKGYSRIRFLIRPLLQKLKLIAVQSDEYRDRFLKLGALPERTVVTGSIKFDGVTTDRNHPRTQELRDWLQIQPDDLVFIAGSTQDPEEKLAEEVFRSLLPEFPHLRLIVVPRHPERGDDVAAMLQAQGHSVVRRSRNGMTLSVSNRPVGLLDTVGELGACWGLADVAFVGGSFTRRGGQNMLEPAAYGAAVCYGPDTRNFRQIVEMLEQAQGTVRVQSPEELRQFVREMLTHREAARAMGERAQRLVLEQQGATARTVEQILSVIDQKSERNRSAA